MSTKKEIVDQISEETGLTQTDVKMIVQKTFDYIFNILVQGGHIELRDFGVFYVKTQKPRIGRNPKKPEVPIAVPAKRVAAFKPGKLLKKKVSEFKE